MSDAPLLTDIQGSIAILTLNRAAKRNAMSEALLEAIDAFFRTPPEGVRCVVLTGSGGHYCAGLDLGEHQSRDAEGVMRHSRLWHEVFDRLQFGGLPIVSAMEGAVIGGGLELAVATHVRVADETTVFQLPEGRRGIFVGGGATVRVGRILGADRMTEMMLTGRRYGAYDAERLGLTHYVVNKGEALTKALQLASDIAQNATLSNYIMIQALARIEDMSKADGFFTESLAAALTQTSPDAEEGLKAFLEKRSPKFR